MLFTLHSVLQTDSKQVRRGLQFEWVSLVSTGADLRTDVHNNYRPIIKS